MMTTTPPYDFLIFIGRFQPFHNGHKRVIDEAFSKARHVIVLVGSTEQARDTRNPFPFESVRDMISNTYGENKNSRLHIRNVPDSPYNDDKWLTTVRKTVSTVINNINYWDHPLDDDTPPIKQKDQKIGLIGMSKDHTSFYLNLFPEWESERVQQVTEDRLINATDIRYMLFSDDYMSNRFEEIVSLVSSHTFDVLRKFYNSSDWTKIVAEQSFLEQHARRWASAPYPPTFNTVDSVVTQSGNVLVIRRKAVPGKGLLAMPGGYIGIHETLLESMIRELKEETKIKVPERVLVGSIKRQKTYDAPSRSPRGRIITQAYHIELPPGPLPKVRGADDAAEAFWMRLSDMKPSEFFEDHYYIIQDLLSL